MPDEPLTIGDEYRSVIKGDAKSIWMKQMGYDCAVMNNAHTKAQQKRDDFDSLDAYIAHEEQNPYPGYSVARDGDELLITYDPAAMNEKIRCYCPHMEALVSRSKTPLNFCQCAAGHNEYIWRHVTGKALTADILCSCLNGDDTCKFVVNLEPHE